MTRRPIMAGQANGTFGSNWISLPVLIGALDSSSYIYLLSGTTELAFYAAVLLLKLAALAFAAEDLGQARRFLPFAAVALLAIITSSFANDVTLLEALKPVGAIVSIILTLTIVRHDITGYAKGMALSCGVICGLYLASAAAGVLETTGNRHAFFNGHHPNLGGELISTTLVMAAFALKPRLFTPLAIAALYCTFLMQSRTSTVAILVSIGCYFTFHSSIRWGWRSTALAAATVLSLLAGFVAVAAAFQQESFEAIYRFVIDSVFLVEDEYRGGDSGLSGRDQHWLAAIEVISEHPFIGVGPDFTARQGGLQPHNWLLYAVTQYGVFGWVLAALFLAAALKAIKHQPLRLIAFVPLFVPWLLNDRFLNFNVYPFVLYILAFAPFPAATRQKAGASLSRLRSRRTSGGPMHPHLPRRYREQQAT